MEIVAEITGNQNSQFSVREDCIILSRNNLFHGVVQSLELRIFRVTFEIGYSCKIEI